MNASTARSILQATIVAATLSVCFGAIGFAQEEPRNFVIVGQLDQSIGFQKQSNESINHFIDLVLESLVIDDAKVEFLDSEKIKLVLPNTSRETVDRLWAQLTFRAELLFRVVASSLSQPQLTRAATESADEKIQMVYPTGTSEEAREQTKPIGQWVLLARDLTGDSADDNQRAADALFKFTPNDSNLLRDRRSGQIITPDFSSLDKLNYDAKREAFTAWCKKQGHKEVEILVCHPKREREAANGSYIISATKGMSESANPRIEFQLNAQGGKRLFSLTSKYRPSGNRHSLLGIVFNGQLITAPRINSPIRSHGVIEGSFSDEEVEQIVFSLNATRRSIPLAKEWLSIEGLK